MKTSTRRNKKGITRERQKAKKGQRMEKRKGKAYKEANED